MQAGEHIGVVARCVAGRQGGRRQLSLTEAGCQMWTQPEVSGMLSWPTGLTPPLVDSGPRQALSTRCAGDLLGIVVLFYVMSLLTPLL